MSVNSKMTAIADAVRTLRGLSGTMNLDAMATNIDGANTAVSDALAALTEKGVTVPDGTTVDGLAALIAAIEAGGGGGDVDLSDMTFCRFEYVTPSENMTELNFGFDLVYDHIFAIGIADRNGISLESGAIKAGLYVSSGWSTRLCSTTKAESGLVPFASESSMNFNSTHYLQAGITYKYVIIGK